MYRNGMEFNMRPLVSRVKVKALMKSLEEEILRLRSEDKARKYQFKEVA